MGNGGGKLTNAPLMNVSAPAGSGTATGKSLKCVVVGDHVAGKSSLIFTYTSGKFPDHMPPTQIDNYNVFVTADGKPAQLGIWDTVGTPDHDRLRPLSYEGTECFIIAFDVNDRSALERIKSKWFTEIRYHSKDAPIVVVGLQTDRRSADPKQSVSADEGVKAAQKCCKNVRYLECSAKTGNGLKAVFDTVISLALLSQTDAGATEKKMKKPVIYLYPPETTAVSVRVTLKNSELIAQYPAMVVATPTPPPQHQQHDIVVQQQQEPPMALQVNS